MTPRRLSLTLSALAIAVSCALPARAEIFLKAVSGADTVLVNDLGSPGIAAYPFQTIGNFTSTSIGFGFPDIGSAANPILDIGSSNSSASGGTLTLMLSETGFAGTTTAKLFQSILTGLNINSSVVMSTYYDPSDNAFATTTPLATDLLNGQSLVTSVPPISGPYSLTEVITVTAGPGSLTSIDAGIVDAPEPGSLSLLGAAMLLLGALGATQAGRHRRGLLPQS